MSYKRTGKGPRLTESYRAHWRNRRRNSRPAKSRRERLEAARRA